MTTNNNAVAVAERRGRLEAQIEAVDERIEVLKLKIAANKIELADLEAKYQEHLKNRPTNDTNNQ